MKDVENKTIQVPDPIFSNYLIKKNPGAQRTYLLLHGFGQTAEHFLKNVSPALPKDINVLVPNGPFFVPVLVQGKYRRGHAWYFYDLEKDEYIVEMQAAINYVTKIFETEKLLDLPIVVIGYSQGGYLSPFLGFNLLKTEKVIGINCQFLDQEFEKTPTFEMVGIHGEKDEVVDYKNSEKSMKNLKSKGVKGEYHLIPDQNHRLNPDFIKSIQKIIQ